jgi:hypothetical protein
VSDRATAPHTDDNYRDVCKKKGVEPRSEVLPDGTVAHWLGKRGADKIILNFHGEFCSSRWQMLESGMECQLVNSGIVIWDEMRISSKLEFEFWRLRC